MRERRQEPSGEAGHCPAWDLYCPALSHAPPRTFVSLSRPPRSAEDEGTLGTRSDDRKQLPLRTPSGRRISDLTRCVACPGQLASSIQCKYAILTSSIALDTLEYTTLVHTAGTRSMLTIARRRMATTRHNTPLAKSSLFPSGSKEKRLPAAVARSMFVGRWLEISPVKGRPHNTGLTATSATCWQGSGLIAPRVTAQYICHLASASQM